MFFKLPHSSSLYQYLLIILCLSLTACELKNQKVIKRTQFIMGTLVEITIQESNNDLAQHAINKSFNEMSRLEKIMSTHLPNSELSQLNTLARRETKITVSSDLLKVIQRGVHWGKLSNGAMDITIGPAVKLWEFNTETPTLPDAAKLQEATSFIDYKNIAIDGSSVSLKKTGMSLHLGAIGKGYAVDQAIGILKKMGVKSGLVNAGGDLMAFGFKKNSENSNFGLKITIFGLKITILA